MPKTCGTMSPPARPCSTRSAMSASAEGASAQAAEATAKAASEARKTVRRPWSSPRRPPVMRPEPRASV